MPQIMVSPHSFKREIKETFSLSVPLVVSQLVYASSSFVSIAMVSNLGADALAASVLVSMIWMSLSVLFFGMLNSVSVLVAHQYGAGNYKAISEIMGQSLILGLLVTFAIILFLSSMPWFLHFTIQPPAVIKLSLDYMYSLLWMIPALVLLIILEQFLAGINRAKMVLRISLLVVPIEIPLIYFLVFGKFGLPQCGIAGIGYGFFITYTGTAIVLVYYLLRAKAYHKFAIFKKIYQLNWRVLKELIMIGLPMGFMHVIEVSAFTVATFWIAKFGTVELAAHQIVMQYLGFAITFVFAMSQAVTVRVGHAVGRQDKTEIYYAIFVGLMLDTACILLVALAFNIFPHFFLRLDIDLQQIHNLSLIQQSSLLLGIGGILMLFDNFRIIGFGALRGLKDTQFSMLASFVAFWLIGLSSAYFLAFIWQWQGKGIWWGLTLGIASGALIILLRLYFLLQRINLAKLMHGFTKQ